MAKYYTAEKAKYGIFTGAVIPFSVTLSNIQEVAAKAPAGYLKCDGGIYRGKDYPILAEMLGLGSNSKFRKDNITLQEPNAEGTEGQFQVPDLGAKFIQASTFAGGYNNLYTTDTSGNIVPVVGIPGELSVNQGNNFDVFYEGSFIVGTTPVVFPSSMNFASTLTPTVPNTILRNTDFLGHMHHTNCAVKRSGPYNSANIPGIDGLQSGNDGDIIIADSITISDTAGTENSTKHGHVAEITSVSRSTTSNIDSFELSAGSISTNITLNQSNTVKFDDVQHKFILVEYLIKF